jgi:hypothetical protein
MDALIILGGLPQPSKSIGAEIKDMLKTAMPNYDAVCQAVHKASLPEPLKS